MFIMFRTGEGLASLGRRASVGEQSQAVSIQREEATVASCCLHTVQSSLNTRPPTGTDMLRGVANSHGSEASVSVTAEPVSSVHTGLSDICHSGLLLLAGVWLHPISCLLSLLPEYG